MAKFTWPRGRTLLQPATSRSGGVEQRSWSVQSLRFLAVGVLNTLIERPLHAWVGLIFMAFGVGAYFFFKRSGAR